MGVPRRMASSGGHSVNLRPAALHSCRLVGLRPMTSHFPWLSRRPQDLALSSSLRISEIADLTDPPMPMWSRQPEMNSDWMWRRSGLMARLNNIGPRGFRLCTPSAELIVKSPKDRSDGAPYAESKYRSRPGADLTTASRTISLRTALNVFAKSSFTNTWVAGMLSKKRLAAWARASAPPFTPIPDWCRTKTLAHRSAMLRQATLAASLLRVTPTAIGLTPPSFLLKAKKLTPKNAGRAQSGVFPVRTKLTKAVSEELSVPPTCLSVMSFKCWGRSPSGPPAGSRRKCLDCSQHLIRWNDKRLGFTRGGLTAVYRCRGMLGEQRLVGVEWWR